MHSLALIVYPISTYPLPLPLPITTTTITHHHTNPFGTANRRTNERQRCEHARMYTHMYTHARSLARTVYTPHARTPRSPCPPPAYRVLPWDPVMRHDRRVPRDLVASILASPCHPRPALPCIACLPACPALLARLVCRFLFLLVSRLHLLVAPVLARPPCTQSTRAVWPNNNFFAFRFSFFRAPSPAPSHFLKVYASLTIRSPLLLLLLLTLPARPPPRHPPPTHTRTHARMHACTPRLYIE